MELLEYTVWRPRPDTLRLANQLKGHSWPVEIPATAISNTGDDWLNGAVGGGEMAP